MDIGAISAYSDLMSSKLSNSKVDALKNTDYLADGDVLTEEEQNIMRRGRNAKPYTKAKNASKFLASGDKVKSVKTR